MGFIGALVSRLKKSSLEIILKKEELLDTKGNMCFYSLPDSLECSTLEVVEVNRKKVYFTDHPINYERGSWEEKVEFTSRLIRVGIYKHSKLRQIIRNISTFYTLEADIFLIDDLEGRDYYSTFYQVLKRKGIKQSERVLEKALESFPWVKSVESLGNRNLKIRLDSVNRLETEYKIVCSTGDYIIGKKDKEYIKVSLGDETIKFGRRI